MCARLRVHSPTVVRRLALLSLVLATAAQEQAPPPSEASFRRAPVPARGLIALAGVAGGAGAAAGTYAVLYPASDQPAGLAVVVVAYPLGMTAATVLVAEALGYDAPLSSTAVDGVLGLATGVAAGSLVGLAVGGTLYLITGPQDYNFVPALIGAGTGLVTALGVAGTVSTRRVGIAPATLRVPMGEPGLGLSLRLDF